MQLDCSLIQAFSLGKPVFCVQSRGNCIFYVSMPIRFLALFPNFDSKDFIVHYYSSYGLIFLPKSLRKRLSQDLDKKIDYGQRIR